MYGFILTPTEWTLLHCQRRLYLLQWKFWKPLHEIKHLFLVSLFEDTERGQYVRSKHTACVLLALLYWSHRVQERLDYSKNYLFFQAELGTQHQTHAVAAMLLAIFKIIYIQLCELQSQQWIRYSTLSFPRSLLGIYSLHAMLYSKPQYSWLDNSIKLLLITVSYDLAITAPVNSHT